MTQKNYQIGDLVQLKSGGPTMTVTGVVGPRFVECKWFSGSKCEVDQFPKAALQDPEQKKKPQK